MRISQLHHVYTMSPAHPAAGAVRPGQRLVVATLDCYNDQVTPDPESYGRVDQAQYNPATGPLYVEGAEPGDVLAVSIEDIRLRDYGVVTVRPQGGGAHTKMGVQRVYTPRVQPGRIDWPGGWELPVRAMIGVIGVAPADGEVPTVTPGDHGGNMDVRQIGPGSRVYLPVAVPGALLSLGDVHALMGDGESSGSGVEIAAEVTLRIEVDKTARLRRPTVETEDEWLLIASAPTLDEAAGIVLDDAVEVLAAMGGLARPDAYALCGLLGDLRVAQLVNPLKTMKIHFAKRDLERLPFYRGRLLAPRQA